MPEVKEAALVTRTPSRRGGSLARPAIGRHPGGRYSTWIFVAPHRGAQDTRIDESQLIQGSICGWGANPCSITSPPPLAIRFASESHARAAGLRSSLPQTTAIAQSFARQPMELPAHGDSSIALARMPGESCSNWTRCLNSSSLTRTSQHATFQSVSPATEANLTHKSSTVQRFVADRRKNLRFFPFSAKTQRLTAANARS